MLIQININDRDKETHCPVKASMKLSTMNIIDHTGYIKKGSDMVSKSQLGKIYLVIRSRDTLAEAIWDP